MLKYYYNEIEALNQEMDENLIQIYFEMVKNKPNNVNSSSQRELEVSHRIYNYQNKDIIIRVWPEFTQVGLAMWPAGW